MDWCDAALAVRAEEIMAALIQYCTTTGEYLREDKAQMYAALGEVEATMTEERSALQTTYRRIIRDHLKLGATNLRYLLIHFLAYDSAL